MTEGPQQKEPSAIISSAWKGERRKKGPDYYKKPKDEYKSFILKNGLLPMPSVIVAVVARTISLFTADVKSRKIIAVSRETKKKALKTNIGVKVLARRFNAM